MSSGMAVPNTNKIRQKSIELIYLNPDFSSDVCLCIEHLKFICLYVIGNPLVSFM